MKVGDINYDFMDMSSLVRVGVHYGHKVTLVRSVMKPYILGNWHGINIINVDKTLTALEASLNVVFEAICANKNILFLCNGLSYSRGIAQPLAEAGQHCIIREFGGVVTNWTTFKFVGNRIKRYLKVIDAVKNKRIINYYNRRVARASKRFISLPELGELPGAVVLFCSSGLDRAVAEANRAGVPVVGLADSLSNVAGVDYVIPVCEGSDRVNSFLCELFARICNRAALVSKRVRLFGLAIGSSAVRLRGRAIAQALALLCTHFKSTYLAFESVKIARAAARAIDAINVRSMLSILVSLIFFKCVSLKTSLKDVVNLCKLKLLTAKLSNVVSARMHSLVKWLECVRCLLDVRSKVIPNRIMMLYGKYGIRGADANECIPKLTVVKNTHIDYWGVRYSNSNVVSTFDYFFDLSK
ncbi:MAG: 30S ribosomal protein S2 [Candidatus Hodgkinia cicadicola]